MSAPTVWACKTHSRVFVRFDGVCPGGAVAADCVPAEMRLVPESALVVLRDEEGNWPEWALQAVAANTEWKAHATKFADHGYTIRATVLDILNGLAAASKEGKT